METERLMKINMSQIWNAHLAQLFYIESHCLVLRYCSLPDGSVYKMRREDTKNKKRMKWHQISTKTEKKLSYLSCIHLIKRQEQGGKRGKHLPKTRSLAYTSVKTNLSSIIGLTNKLTGDYSRWCHSKSGWTCFCWCHSSFEAHLTAPSLLV